jgi:hypothetical protein
LTQQDRVEPERRRSAHVHDTTEENAPKDAKVWKQKSWQIVHSTVEHVHGPEEIDYGIEELVVLCLVRDGRPYVRSFVEHYSSMGAKHLVFLDNGSTDGTVEALKGYDNVTVLRTVLPFKEYQGVMKRYLVRRFGQGRWSLYVDIDELFDYPYSDVVGLDSLLGYLNRNSYTAVVAQMLDMFPEEPLTGRPSSLDEPLKERHRFYDISNLKRWRITEHKRCPPDNTYGSDDIAAFSGGILWTVFGVSNFLTKHPLMFLDDKLRPLAGSHWVSNAKVADFTCVLYHYKFLDGHLQRQATQAAQERKSRLNYKGADRYRQYSELLKKTSSLSIRADTSRELNSVNDLVGTPFMSVSRQYMRFVESEEKRNGDYPIESRSEGLFEAFFNATEEVRSLAEQVDSLRRENQSLHRRYDRSAERVESLHQSMAEHKRSAAQLQNRLEESERSAAPLRSRLAEAERAEQDLVLLLSYLTTSPFGWVFRTRENFRILEQRYLGTDD